MNGLKFDFEGKVVEQETPIPGPTCFHWLPGARYIFVTPPGKQTRNS
jgi:hypothetical protein